MKAAIAVILLFVAAVLAGNVYKNGAAEITEDPEDLFRVWMYNWAKEYSDAEYQVRLNNFKTNIANINQMNSESESAVFGLNHFSDMSETEFRTTVLMANPIKVPETPQNVKVNPRPHIVRDVPTTLDWRTKGAVTPVKNQEQCGSCWAFSATEAIESAWILAGKATNMTIDLAPQQIVDCDTTSDGCNGGETASAYEYIISAGGLESNVSYPYHAVNGDCAFEKKEVVASITGYNEGTTLGDEHKLQDNLVAWGPLSICVDASKWQNYQSGVLSHSQCAFFNILDHCVQLVGYDTTNSDSQYWIVRNSWSPYWGIDGYIWLEMWHDTCGLNKEATWPTVAK